MTASWRERMGHDRTQDGARAYRDKHRRTFLRRIADRREQALLHRTLDRLGAFESVLDCPCGTAASTSSSACGFFTTSRTPPIACASSGTSAASPARVSCSRSPTRIPGAARARSRRTPLSRAQLAGEAAAAGLELDETVLSVNGLFSRFSFALLRIRQN